MPMRGLFPEDLSTEDILGAMREQGEYLDISANDALALYKMAFAHAMARIERDVPVREIMTGKVITVHPEHTALEAAKIMAENTISGAPVVSGNTVVGVISIKDLLHLLGFKHDASAAALVARCLDPGTCDIPGNSTVFRTRVAEIMSSPAITITPDAKRSEAARNLSERNVNRLPVVERGELRGIVTRGDVARTCRVLHAGSKA